jgi:ferric-dicitrate binding protein FerR (iron transport regulator)
MTDEILFKYISDQADDNEKRKVQEWSTVSEERKHELSRMKNSWVLASLSNEIDPIIKERAIQLILDKIKTLNRKNNFRDVRIKWMKYAATILLIIGLSVASGYFISVSKFSNSSFTEVIVPNGERSKVILPDGSIVWLNGGSQLKFESAFQSGKRNVVLVGEAFFEVAPNKSHPFLVGTNSKLQVEVLGTSFNVCSYPDDKIITTYLASGKVKISINGEDDVFLKPSEVLKFEKSSGEMIKQTIGDDRFFDWTRGILNIKGETIEELAKKLERRFDVGILFGDNEVRNHIYSGVIKDENLNTVLEALKFASSLEYEQNGKIITIYSQK